MSFLTLKSEKTIKCPLVNRLVEDGFCFETSLAAEGHMTKYFWPDELIYSEELAQKCLNCPNHRD